MATISINEKEFRATLNRAAKEISDLSEVFHLMKESWFKSNKSIFDEGRKGPGKYDDLKESTKKQKKRNLGFEYPVLFATGKLARSMTNEGDENSVVKIGKKAMFLGTKATTVKGFRYAVALQEGTKNMPPRPYVLLGAEQVAPSPINKRINLWSELLIDWVYQKTNRVI